MFYLFSIEKIKDHMRNDQNHDLLLLGYSFKIRGAMNAILKRKEESPGVNMESLTVVTCSAGNMGQGGNSIGFFKPPKVG